MPSVRRAVSRLAVPINYWEGDHLLYGDCGVRCGLGHRNPKGPVPADEFICIGDPQLMRQAWTDHRERLLGHWTLAVPDKGLPLALGCYGIPAFGQVVFDGVEWPCERKRWPDWVGRQFRMMEHNIGLWERDYGAA